MALFNSSNPILKESTYDGTIFQGMTITDTMTIKGTANKFGFLFLMMMGSTFFSWNQFENGANPMPLLLIGIFGGFILAIIMAFKMSWSPYIAPAFALLEGLFIGSISAFYYEAFKEKHPGIVMQAVLLTLIVGIIMFAIFRYRIIRVTDKFRSVVIIATLSIAFFYALKLILRLFGVHFGGFTNDATPLGIGFSIVVVCLASLNLLLNFDMIEKGVENKAPKYMEWYSAFGLLVTIVWLYLEILRLLAKLNRR